MGRPKATVKSPSAGWKMFGSRIPPELTKAVKIYSVKSEVSVQDLMIEALKDVLVKHGEKPPKE